MSARIKTFKEFWPFYLSQHRHPVNRALHFIGTSLVLLCLIGLAVTGKVEWIWLPFVLGYGPAWIGHFIVEKNRPATFTYPFYSLAADFVMFFKAFNGTLSRELKT